MVLFYQPDEMHLRQSGSQHHDQHRELHALKAARGLVSVGWKCGYKNGLDIGYPYAAKVVDLEQNPEGLTRCEVYDVGMSNPWLAGFGKRACISSSFDTRMVKAKVSYYSLGPGYKKS
eukprot:scaffold217_cov341-Pavlova_lutheri.AAC.16